MDVRACTFSCMQTGFGKHMKTRYSRLTILACLTVVLLLTPMAVKAQWTSGPLSYNYNTAYSFKITGCSDISGDVTIPPSFSNPNYPSDPFNPTLPVNLIFNSAFLNRTHVNSVTIPNSVGEIRGNAFQGCTALRYVTMPYGVAMGGDCIFYGCSSLTNVSPIYFGSAIPIGMFLGCSSLVNIPIPNTVTTIGDNAFNGCSSLTNIVIPDSVTSIGLGAFSQCSGLASVPAWTRIAPLRPLPCDN